MIMKFNYEFEFDVESFAQWVEEEYEYFDCDYTEEENKQRLIKMLYNYVEDSDSIPLIIIREDIDCYGSKKYASKIVDNAYEILEEEKRIMLEEKKGKEKEEIMEHLRFITDYCEKQCNCIDCPMYEICDGAIGDLRIKSNR